MNLETLKAVAAKFATLRKFRAVRRVDSCAVTPDRRLCMPGDEITVIKWHCFKGPTVINVRGECGNHWNGEKCIPWEWVLEMGAPKELSAYMPFAPKTWEEIIAEESK